MNKEDCPDCGGTGYQFFPTVNPKVSGTHACKTCKGQSGKDSVVKNQLAPAPSIGGLNPGRVAQLVHEFKIEVWRLKGSIELDTCGWYALIFGWTLAQGEDFDDCIALAEYIHENLLKQCSTPNQNAQKPGKNGKLPEGEAGSL